VAVTGNHDNETFCQTLELVMTLASPAGGKESQVKSAGRLYLATTPTLLKLAGPQGEPVQFLLMPYPMPACYLTAPEAQHYISLEERNRHLHDAFTGRLRALQQGDGFDPGLPTVVAAHVHVRGARLPGLFRISEEESVLFGRDEIPIQYAYVALGHIHQPQALVGLDHVRYSGSIDRLDLGERNDDKCVVLVDVEAEGRRGQPRTLPLDATPIYSIEIREPATEIPALRECYPDARRDLVNIQLTYTAGVDNLEKVLRELDEIFPRWYVRNWSESGALGLSLAAAEDLPARGFEDTVREYLKQELVNHPPEDCDAVLCLAEQLLHEVQA
jgi:exonuclease SbcD